MTYIDNQLGDTKKAYIPSLYKLLSEIWHYLRMQRKLQLALLLILMVTSALAELISLGSVLPFLAVLNSPDLIVQYPFIEAIVSRLGIQDNSQLLILVTITFVFATIFSASIRIANLWANGKLAAAIGSDVSFEVYRRTLYQPYSVHIQRNSSYIIDAITNHIGGTVVAFNAFLQLITATILSAAMLIGLCIVDSRITLLLVLVIGIAYFALTLLTKHELLNNGKLITAASASRIKALQEGLGAIRDVLLDGSQPAYLKIYDKSDRPQRQLKARNIFLGSFPKYLIEAVGVSFLAILGCILAFNPNKGFFALSLLGLFALGAQRIIPSLQQIYNGLSVLTGLKPSINVVIELLRQNSTFNEANYIAKLELANKVALQSVSFKYCDDSPNVLSQLNIEIFRGERVGLVGSTGCGKSTTLDIIMGLLKPTSGNLLVDDVSIYENVEMLCSWRASVAHVPQNIFLIDGSIAQNIAFGVQDESIDMERVVSSSKQAQLNGFIEGLKHGYLTQVGEQGVRLSGGQRQRIGIARALYKNADFLVLDEATSALDETTESSVMTTIANFDRNLTMIIVAHRLSTLEFCDRVIEIQNGRVVADGPPSTVLYK
ncbi:ABC transporter ATP-binding protein/permease [bacterium]|nr:ABC transporter ATP-binding protein/permease [bacterium]